MDEHDPLAAAAQRAKTYTEPVPTQPAAPAPVLEASTPQPSVTDTRTQSTTAAVVGDVGAGRNDPRAALTTGALSVTDPADTATPTHGWRRAAARLGLPVGPSKADIAAAKQAAELRRSATVVRQSTWTRAVGVLVANRKGGVGKTPTSLALGGVLATERGGSVAIVEVSDDPGTLTLRAEGSPKLGIGELVRDADSITSSGQLSGYTAPQTSYARVIGSARGRGALDGDGLTRAFRCIDTYYQIRVMDSGNQPTSSAFQASVDAADALVIPLLNSADGVLEAESLLRYLRTLGPHGQRLADTSTVVRLVDGRPENPDVMQHLDALLHAAKPGAILTVPYDPHIADRGEITLSRLAPATRAAFTHVAASTIHALNHNVNR